VDESKTERESTGQRRGKERLRKSYKQRDPLAKLLKRGGKVRECFC
jgi:hypothetical protein